jgi:hypothetical protein
MNHGHFFRLNPFLSKVEDGICIFDYTDLMAYPGRSKDNLMSPKFPISVSITENAVRFHLHYSAYKVVKKLAQLQRHEEEHVGEQAGEGEDEDAVEIASIGTEHAEDEVNLQPKYYFDLNDALSGKNQQGDVILRHMEEVIMDLPFTNDSTKNLSSTIQLIYNSQFPYIENTTSYGGRFLEQKIKACYAVSETKVSTSFSTLWLMDIVSDGRIQLLDEKGHVVKFLRKLLLDFMFDLKHSNVFQNSIYYQQMYSGLMSDFYFSALMHKCEYYYYRILTRKAIVAAKIEKEDISNETRQSITTLYAKELFQAESLWMEDIMSPQAEAFFAKNYPNDYYYFKGFEKRIKNANLGTNQFELWPSWFAEPEEEMKRVCFKTEEKNDVPHICNADTLVELLQLEKKEKGENSNFEKIVTELLALRNQYREKASKWFLKRYDFNDVLHLHFFKGANTICVILLILALSWIIYEQTSFSWFEKIPTWLKISIVVVALFFVIIRVVLRFRKTLRQAENKEWGELVTARNWIAIKRCFFQSICIILMLMVCFFILRKAWWPFLFSLLLLLFWAFCGSYIFNLPKSDFVAKLHLLLPRAVASITLAWFTLSAGFDLYASFFDSTPSWRHAILISVVVFLFIMYEINRITPSIPTWKKVLRSLESLIISYTISLIVGFFIIDFLGAKYMERSDILDGFYTEYVNDSESGGVKMMGLSKPDTTIMRGKVKNLVSIYHVKDNKDYSPIASIIEPFDDGLQFFVLPNFLIMFSFIAMFIGIFIQLIILGDNRQITEF